MYVRAFYNIAVAIQGRRLFGSFGFKLHKTDKERTLAKVVADYQERVHLPEYNDWQDT